MQALERDVGKTLLKRLALLTRLLAQADNLHGAGLVFFQLRNFFDDTAAALMIEITLNGAPVQLLAPLCIAALLAERGLSGKRVAVELNGQIVPKSLHTQTVVRPSDRLEIVVAVGGG